MSGTLAFVAFANSSPPFNLIPLESGLKAEYYKGIGGVAQFLLGSTINGFFALGAILAGCMAILWAGEVWRKPDAQKSYRSTSLAAMKMVFAFFWTSFGIFAWVGMPLYSCMVEAARALK